jgi:hypothetical protein
MKYKFSLIFAFWLVVAAVPGIPAQDIDIDVDKWRATAYEDSLPQHYRWLWIWPTNTEEIEARDHDLENVPYESISLKRTSCFGPCPEYEIVINRDGTARYNGIQHAPRKGEYGGSVNLINYLRLCYLLDRFEYIKMRDSYSNPITDGGSTIIKVVMSDGSGTKLVSAYNNAGPVEFWCVAQIIDSVSEQVNWLSKDRTSN